jgi:hypothetical protein
VPPHRGRRSSQWSEKTEERRIQHQCKRIRKHIHPHHVLAVVFRTGARSTHAMCQPTPASSLPCVEAHALEVGTRAQRRARIVEAPRRRCTEAHLQTGTISRQLSLVSCSSTVPCRLALALDTASNGGHTEECHYFPLGALFPQGSFAGSFYDPDILCPNELQKELRLVLRPISFGSRGIQDFQILSKSSNFFCNGWQGSSRGYFSQVATSTASHR